MELKDQSFVPRGLQPKVLIDVVKMFYRIRTFLITTASGIQSQHRVSFRQLLIRNKVAIGNKPH